MAIYNRLTSKQTAIAVLGLGYVGLPLALEFAKHFKVIGFDIDSRLIESLKAKVDPAGEVEPTRFENVDIVFSDNEQVLKQASFYIIAVPTPIDQNYLPDLSLLYNACQIVAKYLKPGDYVVLEATVYPGCTEEECIPMLEQISGLKCGKDFKVGFSPERINPGDKKHTLSNVVKITSGCDPQAADQIAKVYQTIIKQGVFRASSIKVAEAAKIIENTQRDVNIAIMNELAMILNEMEIDTNEVIRAASTKWNFLKFTPGLVGGHCIGVDPYYLIYKARKLGYEPELFIAARRVNERVASHVVDNILRLMASNRINIIDANALVLGITYKENVRDIRNSKVAKIVHSLKQYNFNVDVYDPKADSEEVRRAYKIDLIGQIPEHKYDVVILAVLHDEFKNLDEEQIKKLYRRYKGLFVDIKGYFGNKLSDLLYWSL